MRVLAVLFASIATFAAAEDDIKTFRTCRHTNYVTEGNQIFAVDPINPTIKTEIQIKGVQWLGMESPNGIPLGLWGKGSVQGDSGINGTALADMLKFLYANKFNSVRLPLAANNLIDDIFPKVTYIHGENREIALYDKNFTPKMSDFLARFIGSFQKYRISVVLDIHTLTARFAQDAYWYYPTNTGIESSTTYKAAVLLAKNYCNPTYWNVLGIDLKNAMTDAEWGSTSKDGSPDKDWAAAAEVIAAKVNELCPQWIVFVAGGSKGGFTVKPNTYKVWPGLNFANATKRPLKAKNVVYSPQAFSQGLEPLGYFFSPDSNCSNAILSDRNTECVTIVDGQKVPNTYRALSCENSKFQCQSYKPLTDLPTTFKRLLDENLGDVVKDAKVPIVFGSFSGVYGTSQPLQTSVIDLLIKYIGSSTSGGFFASLNPDTEMWLESPATGNKTVGKARYGLMTARSWQVANEDLLTALSAMKTSEIPCYGDLKPGAPDVPANGAGTLVLAMTPFVLGALTLLF